MMLMKVKEFAGHAGPIYALCKGRGPGKILSASGDRFIAEWDLEQGTASPFSVKLEAPVFSIAYAIEEQWLFAGTDQGNIHVLDLQKKIEIKNLKVHESGIFSMRYLDEHQLFIAAGGDGSLSVWQPKTWKLLRQFRVSESKIRSLDRIGEQLAVSCGDGTLKVFDLPWLNELHSMHAHEGGALTAAKHPTKPLIVSGGKDGHLRFWHTEEGLRLVLAIPAHNFGIYGVHFSPDGKTMLSHSRDKTIKLWNSDDVRLIERIERPKFQSHTHSINAAQWLNNHRFISAGDDRKLIMWEIFSDVSKRK